MIIHETKRWFLNLSVFWVFLDKFKIKGVLGLFMDIKEIRAKLASLGKKEIAEHSKKYLKSAYAFYGLRVPQLREIARQIKRDNPEMSIYEAYNLFEELWNSGNHEEMSLALYLLENHRKQFSLETWKFLFKEAEGKQRIEKACSWDHIDELSSHITGEIFFNNSSLTGEIKKLAESRNPWMRRLAIVSQYPLIKKGKIQLTILLAEKLVYDPDIYVQKGAGWMLRECGKKNAVQVQEFIKVHRKMKAAALSYSTEKMLPFRKHIKDLLEQDKLDKNNDGDEMKSELEKIKYFKN